MIAKLRRIVAAVLVVCTAGIGMPLPAQAGMLGTEAVVVSAERQKIESYLAREEVQAQLLAQGVNPADVKARIAALTDEEAAQLASYMDSLPAGGSIVGAIVFIFLVLLITDILGLTRVFPFTRPVR